MTLRDLMSPGSTLADTPPQFRGMPFHQWHMLKIEEKGTKIAKAFFARFVNGVPDEAARTGGRAVATHRDSYGMKGFHA